MNNWPKERVVKEAFQYRSALTAYAMALLRDYALAEDVVQDAFLIVMEKHTDFTPGTSMLAWCRQIVRLKVLELIRSRSHEHTLVDQVLMDAVNDAFSRYDGEEAKSWFAERLDSLASCLDQLPARSSQLLEGLYAHRKSYRQLADSTGMTQEAVQKSLYRSRVQLRLCIEKRIARTHP